ncbi:hypothetical protein [Pontiella sp.]|uniref:hypothetical protein n=1 Tax=Pontiella sp. TaxID=2837462 RepID=UPI0035626322
MNNKKTSPSGWFQIKNLRAQDAHAQAKIALVLMAVIPALSLYYIGTQGAAGGGMPFGAEVVMLCCTIFVAVSGYRILRKYPENIVRLRQYIQDVAEGALPERITLENASYSDDLKFIEDSFNTILCEMSARLVIIEERWRIESGLRKALEEQQRALVQAERHRAMIQSIGAACHHLGQPATTLRMRLFIMKEQAQTLQEVLDIEESIQEVDAICTVLQRLREVNEFRTEPYLQGGDAGASEILAI